MRCCTAVRLAALPVYALFSLVDLVSVYGAAVSGKNYATAMRSTVIHCWQEEEFLILEECSQCTPFHMKSRATCHLTGFIEKINCSMSNTIEYKSCRASQLEKSHFWRFEGVMMGLMVLFVLLVTVRQRALDRHASEKVRRQIESM